MLTKLFELDGTPAVHLQGAPMPPMSPTDEVKNTEFKGKQWYASRKAVKGVTFTNVSMSSMRLFQLTFTDCTFIDCLFIVTRFREVEFHNCSFKDCNFWKAKFERCYLRPETIKFADRYTMDAANVGVTLYHSLLANYADERQDAFFAQADIEFRRWKRFQLARDIREKKAKFWSGNWQRFTSWVYEKTAGYGYKPVRLFIITIILFLIIAFLNRTFIGTDILVNGHRPPELTLVDSVYYSFSVLTVLGFSTMVPDSSAAKLLTVFEALAAIGWLGIFTSVLVKRFLR